MWSRSQAIQPPILGKNLDGDAHPIDAREIGNCRGSRCSEGRTCSERFLVAPGRFSCPDARLSFSRRSRSKHFDLYAAIKNHRLPFTDHQDHFLPSFQQLTAFLLCSLSPTEILCDFNSPKVATLCHLKARPLELDIDLHQDLAGRGAQSPHLDVGQVESILLGAFELSSRVPQILELLTPTPFSWL
jgi:hypothetical protein